MKLTVHRRQKTKLKVQSKIKCRSSKMVSTICHSLRFWTKGYALCMLLRYKNIRFW